MTALRTGSAFSITARTGLFEMIVGVLTHCHTKYTRDRSICIFLFNRTTYQVFVTYLIGALYVHPLWFYKHQQDNWVHSKLFVACQRWWFQWRFWFLPSVPGYLREEEEHKPDPWRNPIERNKKKYIYSYLKCIVYGKLLKPRHSFRITLYTGPSNCPGPQSGSQNKDDRLFSVMQWRTQKVCSVGGGFNKFSWGQRTEGTGVWGR